MLVDFLEFVCTRDPSRRPTLEDVQLRFEMIKNPSLVAAFNRQNIFSREQNHVAVSGGNKPLAAPQAPLEADHEPLRVAAHVLQLADARYYMENPSMITSQIYLGSYTAALNLELLKKKLEITHILNCSLAPNAYPNRFTYLQLPLRDTPGQDLITEAIPNAIQFFQSVLAQGGRIFVHSDKGNSRSAAIVIAWIMFAQKLGLIEACTFVRNRRYVIEPNKGFVRQLVYWSQTQLLELEIMENLRRQAEAHDAAVSEQAGHRRQLMGAVGTANTLALPGR
jgi:protein-tyrosine phosphatase